MGRLSFAVSGLTLVTLFGCGPATPAPAPAVPVPSAPASPAPNPKMTAQTMPIDTLAKGDASQLHQPGYQVIRSVGELKSLTQQAGLGSFDTDVDWATQMVVAVFAGDRPGAIEVSSLQASNDQLIAKVRFQPDPTAEAGSYHLVVIPKSAAELDVRGLPQPVAPGAAPSGIPAGSTATDAATVKILAQGPHSGVKQPVNVIIQTQEEWQAVWGTHSQGLTPAQPQPVVDWSKQTVIGIFLGSQTQGIGGIAIDAVAPTGGQVAVRAHVLGGAPGAAEPFALITVPKVAIPVDIQVTGGPQAQTLGNPPSSQQAPPPAGFGQPVANGARPGFGQPVPGGAGYGTMPGGSPALPGRGSLLGAGSTSGGMLGAGGYVPRR